MGVEIDLTSKQIGHWAMNDNAASTDVADASGNGWTGTAQQNTEDIDVTGKMSGALGFNGSSDVIGISNDLAFLSNPFSLSLWYQTSASGNYYMIAARGSGASNGGFCLYLDSLGRLSVELDNDGGYGNGYGAAYKTTASNDGEWHHAVVTYGSGVLALWQDGVKKTPTTSFSWSPGTPDLAFEFGRQVSSFYFSGALDDVRYFDSVLSDDEIAFLWNGGDGTESDIGTLNEELACGCSAGLGMNAGSGGGMAMGGEVAVGLGMNGGPAGLAMLQGAVNAAMGLSAAPAGLLVLPAGAAAGLGINSQNPGGEPPTMGGLYGALDALGNSAAGMGMQAGDGAVLVLPAGASGGMGMRAADGALAEMLSLAMLEFGIGGEVAGNLLLPAGAAGGMGWSGEAAGIADLAAAVSAGLGLHAGDAALAWMGAVAAIGLGLRGGAGGAIEHGTQMAAILYYLRNVRRIGA